MHTRPTNYRRPARSTQRHPEELARFGWAALGCVATAMAIFSMLAIATGPEENQPVFMVCTTAWVLCAALSWRGFKRQGL